ncbi:MAG: rhombosortase [Desulfobacteraceae bacterium]|jgi:rhomboid family GlyGly-CTERM serine protease|nr:MAG: rhombosortase [Desulfobacteraceae bacterium]
MSAISSDFSVKEGLKGISKIFSGITGIDFSLDVLVLAAMTIFCNLHLVMGWSCGHLIFQYDKIISGEIHRLITHPFVHLSWYHFLLDAGAFMLLYGGMKETRGSRKLMTVSLCGLCGLILPLLLSQALYDNGLSGLSGIAHGLMAFSALEMLQSKTDAKVGMVCLAAVVVKSLYEAVTGHVFFSSLHFGLCGIPIALCHAGGVIGGILSYFIIQYFVFFKPINASKG